MATIWSVDFQELTGTATRPNITYDTSTTAEMALLDASTGPGVENGTNMWQFAKTDGSGGSGYNNRNYGRITRWEDVDNNSANTGWQIPTAAAPDGTGYTNIEYFLKFRWKTTTPMVRSGTNTGWKFFLMPNATSGGSFDGHDRLMLMIWSGSSPGNMNGTTGTDLGNTRFEFGCGVTGIGAYALIDNGEWVHMQVAWRWTNGGTTARIRIWVNNNNESSPTAQNLDLSAIPGGTWDFDSSGVASQHLASIATQGSLVDSDAVFDTMDWSLNDSFDANWAPTGAVDATGSVAPVFAAATF